MTTHKEALEAAYLAGFNASGEGYNGEYPFGDKMQDPAENPAWKKDRDNYIKEALAQPEQLEGLQLIHKADIDLAKKRATEAQPEQEPVAIHQYQMGDGSWIDQAKHSYDYNKRYAPNATVRIVYTTPPQRKPLTDEQIDAIASSVRKADTPESVLIRLSRAIEAAHGIKGEA